MEEQNSIVKRLAISLPLGVLVVGISLLVVWPQYSDVARDITAIYLLQIGEKIEWLDASHQPRPKRLSDLDLDARSSFSKNAAGELEDLWGHPIQYWTDGKRFVITSYGRDGMPGGVGLDYDLVFSSNRERSILLEQATFAQYLSEPLSHGPIAVCICGGLFTFFLILVTLSEYSKDDRKTNKVIVIVVLTLVGTIMVASILTFQNAVPRHLKPW
jgi:hypothetical protein